MEAAHPIVNREGEVRAFHGSPALLVAVCNAGRRRVRQRQTLGPSQKFDSFLHVTLHDGAAVRTGRGWDLIPLCFCRRKQLLHHCGVLGVCRYVFVFVPFKVRPVVVVMEVYMALARGQPRRANCAVEVAVAFPLCPRRVGMLRSRANPHHSRPCGGPSQKFQRCLPIGDRLLIPRAATRITTILKPRKRPGTNRSGEQRS